MAGPGHYGAVEAHGAQAGSARRHRRSAVAGHGCQHGVNCAAILCGPIVHGHPPSVPEHQRQQQPQGRANQVAAVADTTGSATARGAFGARPAACRAGRSSSRTRSVRAGTNRRPVSVARQAGWHHQRATTRPRWSRRMRCDTADGVTWKTAAKGKGSKLPSRTTAASAPRRHSPHRFSFYICFSSKARQFHGLSPGKLTPHVDCRRSPLLPFPMFLQDLSLTGLIVAIGAQNAFVLRARTCCASTVGAVVLFCAWPTPRSHRRRRAGMGRPGRPPAAHAQHWRWVRCSWPCMAAGAAAPRAGRRG